MHCTVSGDQRISPTLSDKLRSSGHCEIRVDEVTIQNRRREVLGDLANKAYALWLKGERFPESMTKMLGELKQLDEHTDRFIRDCLWRRIQ